MERLPIKYEPTTLAGNSSIQFILRIFFDIDDIHIMCVGNGHCGKLLQFFSVNIWRIFKYITFLLHCLAVLQGGRKCLFCVKLPEQKRIW